MRFLGTARLLLIAMALHAYVGFSWWHFLLLGAVVFYPAVW